MPARPKDLLDAEGFATTGLGNGIVKMEDVDPVKPSPRTINPPTAPQPKPSTESSNPVRPKIRISMVVPPIDTNFVSPPLTMV
jgi:hypothetical protein